MALPIDVGPPAYTSRTTPINGTNFSTAMRIFMWDDNFGGIADEDIAIYFDSPTGIHNQSAVYLSPTPAGGKLWTNLHLLNPIGYNNKIITQVLLDFLMEQMHVGHGVIRMLPAGSGAVAQWVPSSGASPHYSYIDEPMTAPNTGDFLNTTVASAEERITFEALPTNALRSREAIITFLGAMTKGPAGSDEGLGFGFEYFGSGVGSISRKLIADMYANDTTAKAARVKLDRIDQLPGVFNGGYLALTAERGTAGASPNPHWYLFCLEMLVYYENNDPSYDVIDSSAFSALDGLYTTHLLDFDVIDTTGYEALLDILAHAPELFLYVDYTGKLKPGRIGAYSAVGSPRALSTEDHTITEITRGPYRVDERYANAVELRWGVIITATGATNATEDPTNPPNDRGSRKYTRGASGIPVAGWEDRKILDRHFIRRDTNKNVAEAVAKMYLHLWGEENGRDVTGLDLTCPYQCIDVEPGDVVALTIPRLGYSARRFRCVEKSLDLEKDCLNLVVYDVENTL